MRRRLTSSLPTVVGPVKEVNSKSGSNKPSIMSTSQDTAVVSRQRSYDLSSKLVPRDKAGRCSNGGHNLAPTAVEKPIAFIVRERPTARTGDTPFGS